MYVTAAVERTKTAPWGLEGGLEARPNGAAIRMPDGSRRYFGKATRLLVPRGATIELYDGGGGGYGNPADRSPEAVHRDIEEGYFSEEFSRKHYPHAFD
jgi:N-methylhydantoinase B